MTKEEAIKYLIKPVATSTEIGKEKQKEFEAYNMAIEALSAEPQLDVYAQEYKAYRESLKAEAKGGDAQMPKATSVMQQTPSEDGDDLISKMGEPISMEESLKDIEPWYEDSDLISRAELLKTVQHPYNQDGEWSTEEIVAIIEIMPSVSTDRPSGEWVNEWKDIDGGRMYGACCSVCHTIGHAGYNYCPRCGARMENTK